MNKNVSSPRNKLYELLNDIFLHAQFNKIPKDFIEHLNINCDTYEINIIVVDEYKYYYKGYPTGNLLKIIVKVIEMWNNQDKFPINFFELNGLIDKTQEEINNLNNQTQLIKAIIGLIKNNNMTIAYNMSFNFFEDIGPRGIMTLLGFRITSGSCVDIIFSKEELLRMFNLTYQKLNRQSQTNISLGGRAVSKHYDRKKDPFWFCKGTEQERNNKANEIFFNLLDECIWINVHFLPNQNKVLEIRNRLGYGMRWNYAGNFRGLIEPEEREEA